ncbi:MAG: HAD hydrolase family protein [Patescibacteria group bacterium]|nr:HAD hydrolase family protein [Patescibacteria group bacterium]MDE2590608.1 HAD hydrolase family protein [Patescibacteria group bacterium]
MIEAIILDVDGVIIGEKVGYNSPHPHMDVLMVLKKIRESKIPVILCTAKPHYAVSDIIDGAKLANPHITDAGAVIIDPIDHAIVKQAIIEKSLARDVLGLLAKENVYVEFYTTEDYFLQENKQSEITEKHNHILQRKPKLLLDIVGESIHYNITKIMPVAKDISDKQRVSEILQPFVGVFSISWGVHPVALPFQFAIITALGSSKKAAAQEAIKSIGKQMENVLGIGDTTSDWNFIEICGYAATLENGSDEIKNLIKQKGEGKYYIGKSVDENGILDVFNYFKIIA